MLIHALTGCIFHCYKCINYKELIEKKHTIYDDIDTVVDAITKQAEIIEYVIISGGEYLMAPLDELIHDLSCMRKASQAKIIIYTTGAYPTKMQTLIDQQVVDGFHIDLKLPYPLLEAADKPLIEMTLGIPYTDDTIIKKMIEGIRITIKHDLGHSQIRSVAYPFMSDSAFAENRRWIESLNKRFQKHTPYEVHPFIDPDTI